MCISTSYLNNFDSLQQVYKSRCWLVRVAFNVGWQVSHRGQTQLATGTGSPRVYVTLDIDSDCVPITSRDLINALVTQLLDFQWIGLERIPISVLGHLADNSAAVAKLAHFTTTPRVQASLFIGMTAVILEEKLEICFRIRSTKASTSLNVHLSFVCYSQINTSC